MSSGGEKRDDVDKNMEKEIGNECMRSKIKIMNVNKLDGPKFAGCWRYIFHYEANKGRPFWIIPIYSFGFIIWIQKEDDFVANFKLIIPIHKYYIIY